MPRLVLPTYQVIRDTREQDGHGWFFSPHSPNHRPPRCLGTVRETLQTGDYSINGYTDLLCIERKFDWDEIWGNYLNHRKRFENELERMSSFKYRFVIIESFLTSELYSLSPPQCRTAVPGRSLIRWIEHISLKFQIPVYAVGPMAKKRCQYIMEEVVRLEKDRWVYAQK